MPAIIRLPVTTKTTEIPDPIILMVQTDDSSYPVSNADEPKQLNDDTFQININ